MVSDPLLDKLHIKDHYEHHQQMVDDLKDQIIDLGYRVSGEEISFGDFCGIGRCRPDIAIESPDGKSIPRGNVAKDFFLIPNPPLKYHGHQYEIIENEITFP